MFRVKQLSEVIQKKCKYGIFMLIKTSIFGEVGIANMVSHYFAMFYKGVKLCWGVYVAGGCLPVHVSAEAKG